MSDTHKEGKRSRRPTLRPEGVSFYKCIAGRHGWGHTEKILRRNRKIWTRLLNKIRRRMDDEKTIESLESSE